MIHNAYQYHKKLKLIRTITKGASGSRLHYNMKATIAELNAPNGMTTKPKGHPKHRPKPKPKPDPQAQPQPTQTVKTMKSDKGFKPEKSVAYIKRAVRRATKHWYTYADYKARFEKGLGKLDPMAAFNKPPPKPRIDYENFENISTCGVQGRRARKPRSRAPKKVANNKRAAPHEDEALLKALRQQSQARQ